MIDTTTTTPPGPEPTGSREDSPDKARLRPIREIEADLADAMTKSKIAKIGPLLTEALPHQIMGKISVEIQVDDEGKAVGTMYYTPMGTQDRRSIICSAENALKTAGHLDLDHEDKTASDIQDAIRRLDTERRTEEIRRLARGIAAHPTAYANRYLQPILTRPTADLPPVWCRTRLGLYEGDGPEEAIAQAIRRTAAIAAGADTDPTRSTADKAAANEETLFLGEYSWMRHNAALVPESTAIRDEDRRLRTRLADAVSDMNARVRAILALPGERPTEAEVRRATGLDHKDIRHILTGAVLTGRAELAKRCARTANASIAFNTADNRHGAPRAQIHVTYTAAYDENDEQQEHVDLPLANGIEMITEPLDAEVGEQLAQLVDELPEETRPDMSGIKVEGPDGPAPLYADGVGNDSPGARKIEQYRTSLKMRVTPAPRTGPPGYGSDQSVADILASTRMAISQNDRIDMRYMLGQLAPPAVVKVTTGGNGQVSVSLDHKMMTEREAEDADLTALVEPAEAIVIAAQTGGTVEPETIQKAVNELERTGDHGAAWRAGACLAADPHILDRLGRKDDKTQKSPERPAHRITFRRYDALDTVKAYNEALCD